MNDAAHWLSWQLLDASFPTGAFAHSGGLEAATHARFVNGLDAVEAFIDASLIDLAQAQLPLLAAAHADVTRLRELDRLCHALLTNHVARRASTGQGQAMLTAAAAAFDPDALHAWRGELVAGKLHGHLAPLFGAITAALDIDRATAQRLMLYTTLRDLLSAAVRLDRLGPLKAQAIQHRLSTRLDHYARRAAASDVDDACQSAPILDILHARHDRLDWRLFHS